jgi:hypothetical protein
MKLQRIASMLLPVALLFVIEYAASAGAISGTPTFLLPNNATNTPTTFASARTVANGYYLTAFYHDADGNQVRQESGTVITDAPGELTWARDANNYARVVADPGAFDAQAYHQAKTDGSVGNYTYGSSQVWNWYVLSGTPGDAVTLAADVLIQGQAFANNGAAGNAGTIFGATLGVLTNPLDLTQDFAISLTGAVNWVGFARADIGNDIHTVNYIIRSQPFTVEVGVLFRLSLQTMVQGFAAQGDLGEAWSNFLDPKLVTAADFPSIAELTPEGLSVLNGQTYSSLADAGYGVNVIPEPAAVLLIGMWLALVAAIPRCARK